MGIPDPGLYTVMCLFNKEKDMDEIRKRYAGSQYYLYDLIERRKVLGV